MVLTGLDRIVARPPAALSRARVGLLCHQASVTRALEPAPDALRRAGFRLTALFAPEHGIAGALQDQVSVSGAVDARARLPVFSLYGDPRKASQKIRLSPTADMLGNVDVLVCDLQDVGIRYYTFAWTLVLAMEACARRGIPVHVLDRPNPLGGERAEGNMPDPAFASFVGLHPVPVRHGLTIGEVALWANERLRPRADLHVVPMTGWKRRMWGDQTGLPWVMPSPNMPTLDTAAVYGGMCLIEGTNLSEGRGTTRPFEIAGAPFVDGHALAGALGRENIPGVRFRPCVFQPTFHKWAGRTCGGVQLHVTDRRSFPSFLAGLLLIRAARRLWPREFSWRPPPYEFEEKKLPFDLLCGTDAIRPAMEDGKDPRAFEPDWRRERARFLRGVERLYA